MSKPVILTGLRANNDLHLGNYLGALLPLVDMAREKAGEYQINLFVPDLHSFTTPIDHDQLQAGIMNNLRVFAAAGLPLDHDDVHIYRQSYVPAHSELTWILDCFTGMGQMQRMTQFKEKTGLSQDEREKLASDFIDSLDRDTKVRIVKAIQDSYGDHPFGKISGQSAVSEFQDILNRYLDKIENEKISKASVGLFNYPVLMAADILLYGAELVPVGDDQTQHLEFTRDIAERLNNQFGELFVVPKPVKEQHEFFGKDQGLRIRDLQNPAKKMSKSAESDKGVIFLTGSPDEARQKIMSAETDSLGEIQYDYEKRPGVSNLLDILKLLGGNPDEFIGQSQYGPLKAAVADKVAAFLDDFQSKLTQVDEGEVLRKLQSSEAQMNQIANERLLNVQKAVGLRS